MEDHKGYILLSRKITGSEIFQKPPLYLKVWIYLLSRAQYKDYKGLKKGQLWVSIDTIREDLCWYIGYRKVTPTRDEIFNVIEWLRFCGESNDESETKAMMITTTRATRGLVINIENYAYYQDPKNYESNDVNNDEKVTKATTKTDRYQHDKLNSIKKEKKDKNKDLNELKTMVISNDRDGWFEEFWNIYPKKIQKKTSEQKFKLHVKDELTFNAIMFDLSTRIKSKDWVKEDGQYVPNPTTYLNQRRWEDEKPQVIKSSGSRIFDLMGESNE